MTIDGPALDRYITGNYGEDQFKDAPTVDPDCPHKYVEVLQSERMAYNAQRYGSSVTVDWDKGTFVEGGIDQAVYCLICGDGLDAKELQIS